MRKPTAGPPSSGRRMLPEVVVGCTMHHSSSQSAKTALSGVLLTNAGSNDASCPPSARHVDGIG